jgi:hypothetical protein
MKKLIFILLLSPLMGMTQSYQQALEKEDISLEERYKVMKETSQTFKDYKVIKRDVLDGVLKISLDSIAALEAKLAESKGAIAAFDQKIKEADLARDQANAEKAEMEYDATHMTVLGVSFNKSFFASLMGIIIAVLLVFLGLVSGRLKMVYSSLKEKLENLEIITREFEEYKRKALDKQMKLSRELQDERNRLAELRN